MEEPISKAIPIQAVIKCTHVPKCTKNALAYIDLKAVITISTNMQCDNYVDNYAV